jgi:hypothetical protein
MEPRRDASKAAFRFHQRWLKFLLKATPQSLKRTAHELAALEEASAEYRDGTIFSVLRKNLEFVIRDVTRTDWSVQRSRKDLRGRRCNSHSRVRIDPRVRRQDHNQPQPCRSTERPRASMTTFGIVVTGKAGPLRRG